MEPVPFVEYQVEAAGVWGATQGEEKMPNREENSNIKIRLRASSSSAKTAPPLPPPTPQRVLNSG
jgi:hypothetical protein